MKSSVVFVFFFALAPLLEAQVFQNLNFEQAAPVYTTNQPEAGYSVDPATTVASALPYWTVEIANTPISVMFGQPTALDQTAVQLVGASFNSSNDTYGHGSGALQGNYSVNLYAVNFGSYLSASISQYGLIPADDQSIQFLISGDPGTDTIPYVTFNGNAISLSVLSTNGGVTTMIGDISAYAGTSGTLAFSAQAQPNPPSSNPYDVYNLDSIVFSTQAAPEPSTWALILGGLGLLSFWRNRPRRSNHA